MAYARTTWVNGSAPAINATNLNNIEQGIVDLASETRTPWYPQAARRTR